MGARNRCSKMTPFRRSHQSGYGDPESGIKMHENHFCSSFLCTDASTDALDIVDETNWPSLPGPRYGYECLHALPLSSLKDFDEVMR